MKKLIIIPLFLLCITSFSQVVQGYFDNGMPGKKITLHGLGTTSTYFLAPNDSTLNFDSTKVVTDVILNSSNDSFYVYRGGTFLRSIKLGTSTGGTLTGGSIAWPGTIYTTPTTGSVSGGTITFSPSLASQSAYTIFGRGSGTGTPSFISGLDSNYVPALHTQTYYDGRYAAIGSSGGGSGGAISSLTAATAKDSINNANYKQEWQWNSLVSNGLKLSSTSTASDSFNVGTQKLFEVNLSGANALTSQETHAVEIYNTHTGTNSTNVGIKATASGATNNYAGIFNGRVGINTGAPTGELEVAGTIVQSINALAISLKDNSAIRGRAATGGNIYIDANAAIDNTGTINLRGNVSITGTTTFSSGLTVPNLTLGSYIRGSTATNGTIYFDLSQDLSTGTLNVRGTTVNVPNLSSTKYYVSALNTAPASATATGAAGEIRWTTAAIYLCIATNTWVRAALATF